MLVKADVNLGISQSLGWLFSLFFVSSLQPGMTMAVFPSSFFCEHFQFELTNSCLDMLRTIKVRKKRVTIVRISKPNKNLVYYSVQ